MRHSVLARDWSSDVCSSDLVPLRVLRLNAVAAIVITGVVHWFLLRPGSDLHGLTALVEIGRASCRERKVNYRLRGTVEKKHTKTERKTQEKHITSTYINKSY